MKTILKILQHRIFIAILLSLILIITIPFNFKKYIAKKEQVTISGSNLNYTFFVDINNNSYSEYYEFNHDKLGNREFFNLLNHSGGIISVLNLQDFLLPRSVIGFNDFNHNQIPELNFLSFNADSIFLNIYEVKLLDQNKTNQVDTIIYFKRKFISTAHYYNDVLDIVSDSIRFADLNNDGFDEAILNLEAGFSLQPRRIFAYDIKHDSLWAMPREATMILDFIPYDLNHDNIPEILLTTYSPNNAFPENIIKEFKKETIDENSRQPNATDIPF
ncbi:MAG TPA: hypothetical protein EYP69_03345 [Bacteroidales bacterium]|nr:hypothetical protein [Bacteroidales bacterium]